MTQTTIYKDTFLISGIMCHQGCGATVQALTSDLNTFKEQQMLPQDACLIIDAEPQSFGVHKLIVTVQSNKTNFKSNSLKIRKLFKEQIESVGTFNIIDETNDSQHKKVHWENGVNILVNLFSLAVIFTLSMIFPPSILLTSSLGILSFATSGFTSRSYLISFFNSIRTQDWGNMSSAVALGWFLALAHALYHSITMPLSTSFSMLFMSFLMPIVLITIVNGMDEVKRLIMNRSKKMQLHGIHSLFPQMTDKYQVHTLSLEQQEQLSLYIENSKDNLCDGGAIERVLSQSSLVFKRKNSLSKGEFIQINSGECFPVDCVVVRGNTLVDSSLLTGELLQEKQLSDFIPAGAINLGQPISVCAIENSYNSSINKLLFRSNRAPESKSAQNNQQFTYYYGALIALGLVAAIFIPLFMGVMTIPLFLQNVTGILFAVCPCTIGIAHELPHILSLYYRNIQGVRLTNEDLLNHQGEIHTVVFDKTGTLTTGNSQIDTCDGITPATWQRIYLLEKQYGAEHPLAKAMCHYYETHFSSPYFTELREGQRDSKNRGISGIVQEKKILLGNADYLFESGIHMPTSHRADIAEKLALGYSAVYVAEDQEYVGVILVKHQIRPHILPALQRLKQQGIKIILLTGDQRSSAQGFNQQHGHIFAAEDIHADQNPEMKETFLTELMKNSANPSGIWFVGDGLNDSPCARIVSENGGISCAMNAEDKAAFFTDLSLNGSLDYLFVHQQLNQFVDKNVVQNQWLLGYGASAFLLFVIGFSITGIAISPLIPMVIMVATTLMTTFNSARVKYSIEYALENKSSWMNQFMNSDVSLALPVTSTLLLLLGVFISSIVTNTISAPILSFSVGVTAGLATACVIGAAVLFGVFLLTGAICAVRDYYFSDEESKGSDDHQFIPVERSEARPQESSRHEYRFSLLQQARHSASELGDPLDYNAGIPAGQRSQLF